tara:strand:+ start:727 stop:1965 length:1239 start_codon:yes stop_codon:yes gene_type:complete
MSDIRGIGDFSSQIEARGRAALNATDVKYKAKEKTDEIIKAVGEGKSYLSGKGLSEKLIGNIKKKASAKLKSLGKDAKAKLEKEGQKAYNTVKEKVSGKIEEAKSAIKGKVEGAVEEAKGAVEDKLASASEKAEAAVEDKIGSTTEELASKFPSIGAPLEGEAAVEGTALRTGQAASRGEQFAQEIKTGSTIGEDARAGLQDAKGTIRIAKKATKIAKKGQKLAKEQRAADEPEPKPPSGPPPKGQPSTLEEANQAWKESQEAAETTSDIALTGEEDTMRVGQTAGQAAGKREVESQVEEKAETEVETQVEEKAVTETETLAPKLETLAPKAETLASKLEPTLAKVGKSATKGAEEGGEIVAEGGGLEDPITDAIGLIIGIGTTIYGLKKKPHTPLAPPPATESSVSYQAGI